MVKGIIKTVVMIVAVVAGGMGASFYKGVSASDAPGHEEDGHSEKKSDDKKKGGDDHGKSSDDGGTTTYMKFKRQFVIPVMKENKIKSLVIMNFNIELNDAAPPNSFNLEPKLRDAFMRSLLNLSNEGVFDDDLTSPETFDYIRETLVGSARGILSQGVENVLILDVAKRDN
jgi:hypothetical protein